MLSKERFSNVIAVIKHYIKLWYLYVFNKTVRQQLNNAKCIPIIIISFNQRFYLEKLVSFLLKANYETIIIIDNHSTYKPLLKYLESIEDQVIVYRLEENLGHLAFWMQQDIFKKHGLGYYVVTDADIVPVEACPHDFLLHFRKLLDKAYSRTKVGFSLRIDDIPDTNPNKMKVQQWESRYWLSKVGPDVFKAEIDTTFALYRPQYQYQLKDFTKAWRTAYPMQAVHGGWYLDIDNLTEEQQYYIKTANESASWNIDIKGELVNPKHKPLYKDG